MAERKILKMGNPLLRKKAEAVPLAEIRSQEIKKLLRDMFDTMKMNHGVGLAAPQVGVLKRIVVVGFDRGGARSSAGKLEVRNLINPEIEILDGPVEGSWEGCLSVPEMRGYVERGRKIRLKWYDEKEELHEEIVEGYDAVVYQHECDHLNGTLYVDRLKDSTRFGFNEELDALEEPL